MADGSLDQVLSWLKGAPPNPQLGLETAPPLAQYPTQHDADYARNYGFADNNINESYLNNQKARVLGLDFPNRTKNDKNNTLFIPASAAGNDGPTLLSDQNSKEIDLNKDPKLQGNLNNMFMQAALSANRSPIAAVGFDPSKVVVDSLIQKPNILGLYRPDADKMYTAINPQDAVVHESTHRGIQKLRDQYPDKVDPIMKRLPDEEMVVRWLMQSKAGDPEGLIDYANADKEQRKSAMTLFNPKVYPITAPRNHQDLNQLEELAIEHMKGRGKRAGPQ